MRIFVLLTLTAVAISAQNTLAQQRPELNNNKIIKQITYDYFTKSFSGDSTFKKLKVNDWVSIKILNFPVGVKVAYKVKFTNRNMEQAGTFGQYTGFAESGGKYTDRDKENYEPVVTPDDVDNADEEKLRELKNQPEFKTFGEKDLKRLEEKDFKLKVDSMKGDLLIGSVEKLVNQLKEKSVYIQDSSLKKLVDKAEEDYKWQKKLVGWLHGNINYNFKIKDEKIALRDSAIEVLNKQVETLARRVPSPVGIEYLPIVHIENYDHTEFQITFDDEKKGKQSLSLPFYNKCGFKLDFSTGLVASGLYSPSYIYQDSGNDSVQIKGKEEGTKFSMGLALLSHAYFRWSRNINPAITSGLVVNLSSQNINYVLGLSALLGSEQRLILSGGAIAGKVKALPDYQKLNTNYNNAAWASGTDVSLIDRTKLSWWIGITYNLGANRGEKTIEF